MKLDESMVARIKERLLDGERYAEIAADYPVRPETIGEIARGLRWSHVPWPVPDPDPKEAA